MANNMSYPMVIDRNVCTVCGCHGGNSYSPWWPDCDIHLFMGIPLCWTCATKIAVQWGNEKVSANTHIDRKIFCQHMADINKEVDYATSGVLVTDSEILRNQKMEDEFKEECKKHKNHRIVDISDDKWERQLIDGFFGSIDSNPWVCMQSKLVIKTDMFTIGEPVFIEYSKEYLEKVRGEFLDKSGSFYGIIKNVDHDKITVMPLTGFECSYSVERIIHGDITITKCVQEKQSPKIRKAACACEASATD